MYVKNVCGSQAFFAIGSQGQNIETKGIAQFADTPAAVAQARVFVARGVLQFVDKGGVVLPAYDPYNQVPKAAPAVVLTKSAPALTPTPVLPVAPPVPPTPPILEKSVATSGNTEVLAGDESLGSELPPSGVDALVGEGNLTSPVVPQTPPPAPAPKSPTFITARPGVLPLP